MKRIGFLLILALLLGTCTKEPPRKPVITGRVVDIVTQKGIAGIEVNVVDFWTDGWNYSVPITGTTTTDSMGNFVVNYTVKDDYDDRILKLDHLPPGYQVGARINGTDETCIYYDLEWDTSSGYRVEDEGSYKVELMPVNTFAYIVKPVVPAAWQTDSISINTSEWDNPLYAPPFISSCHHFSQTIKFAINDNAKWEMLGKPNRLIIGDKVRIEYKVFNGNITRVHQNQFFQCHFNDTTAMVLTF